MNSGLWLALAGLVVTAPAGSAQGACQDIGRFFAQPPKLGEWADVRMDRQKDEGKKPTLMRVGFVGEEQRQGQKMYRMQMVMANKDGKQQIMQTLTPWGPEALSQDYDTEVVMKMGDQPAVIMPVQADKGPGSYDLRKACSKITFVGEETVSVPAGSFKARHYSGPDGESWVSNEVPGWRIAKMVTKDSTTIVVTATGSGFQNQITEKPMDMKAMMGAGKVKGMGVPPAKPEEAK